MLVPLCTQAQLYKVSPTASEGAMEQAGIDNNSYDHLTPWQAFWTVGWLGARWAQLPDDMMGSQHII